MELNYTDRVRIDTNHCGTIDPTLRCEHCSVLKTNLDFASRQQTRVHGHIVTIGLCFDSVISCKLQYYIHGSGLLCARHGCFSGRSRVSAVESQAVFLCQFSKSSSIWGFKLGDRAVYEYDFVV